MGHDIRESDTSEDASLPICVFHTECTSVKSAFKRNSEKRTIFCLTHISLAIYCYYKRHEFGPQGRKRNPKWNTLCVFNNGLSLFKLAQMRICHRYFGKSENCMFDI